MRFLIDECLHPSLTDVANHAGHEAHHVAHYGLASTKDHDLMRVVLEKDFVLVTNNAVDFRRLYGHRQLHAGLVILVPQVRPELQRYLFAAALAEIRADDGLINEALEVRIEEDQVVFNRYNWPA